MLHVFQHAKSKIVVEEKLAKEYSPHGSSSRLLPACMRSTVTHPPSSPPACSIGLDRLMTLLACLMGGYLVTEPHNSPHVLVNAVNLKPWCRSQSERSHTDPLQARLEDHCTGHCACSHVRLFRGCWPGVMRRSLRQDPRRALGGGKSKCNTHPHHTAPRPHQAAQGERPERNRERWGAFPIKSDKEHPGVRLLSLRSCLSHSVTS
jgi:hypothetical protein